MKKKILIPTDFSKNAWNALSYATDLYKNIPCEFYLLNAYNASGYALESMMIPEPGERFYEESKEKSEKGLAKILQQLTIKTQSTNHSFFAVSQYNTVLDAIKDVVNKKDIEMVIMGTKGTTNAGDIVYGSNTVLVMEKVRGCPVMAIPEETMYHKTKKLLQWLEQNKDRIEVFFIPQYSPELNLQEYVNQDLKTNVVSKKRPINKEQLRENITDFMNKRKKDKPLVKKYFRHKHARYAA